MAAVHLIAVPYDSARRGERMGAGPLMLAPALDTRLRAAGHDVRTVVIEAPPDSWRAEIRTAFELARGVAAAVRGAVAEGAFPLVLSGNCGPAAMGSVAGLDTAPAVCWFDAHGDFNTPDTTPGGFLDGMALATLTGHCWPELARGIAGLRPIEERTAVLIGTRDLDPLESARLDASAVGRVAPARVREDLARVLAPIAGSRRQTYIHLDLDVLDPSEGRINVYAAPGGLSRADVAWTIEQIAATMPPAVAALTSFDPAADASGRALDAAVSLGLALVTIGLAGAGGAR